MPADAKPALPAATPAPPAPHVPKREDPVEIKTRVELVRMAFRELTYGTIEIGRASCRERVCMLV